MKTIATWIIGGVSDGILYDRPADQVEGWASDGATEYHYVLDDRARFVLSGETRAAPEALEALERELAEVLA